MTSALTCEPELVCYICQDLLTEHPESSLPTGPPPAKRSRVETLSRDEEEPRPSTSTSISLPPSSSSSSPPVDSTPELCTTKCGHIYHKHCLLDWMKRKKVCPTCRRAVNNKSLTRIFLPLTAGQCRQCNERVRQMDDFQLKYVIEKTRADACEEKEKECRDQSIHLAQENEDIKEKLQLEIEKVEELEAEVAAEKVSAKLNERLMLVKELKSQQEVTQLKQDLQASQVQISDREKSEKELKDAYELLKKENEKTNMINKKLLMQEEQRKNDYATIQDWKNFSLMKGLEVDKLKMECEYERARANFLEGFCMRMWDDPDSPLNSLKMIYIDSEVRLAQFHATNATTLLDSPNSTVNLAEDLEVSESEDEDIGQSNAQENGELKSTVKITSLVYTRNDNRHELSQTSSQDCDNCSESSSSSESDSGSSSSSESDSE